jgi:hypothetical protein
MNKIMQYYLMKGDRESFLRIYNAYKYQQNPHKKGLAKADNQIQANIKDFLKSYGVSISGAGSSFTVEDFNNLNMVLNGTTKDFVIVDNNTARFSIIFDKEVEVGDNTNIPYFVKEIVDSLIANQMDYMIYSYQINKKQTILNSIMPHKRLFMR